MTQPKHASTPAPWVLSPRIGMYQSIPANESERLLLERINAVRFEALSIGAGANGPQVAIIPLDESSKANGVLIESAPNLVKALQDCVAMFDEGVPEAEWAEIKRNARALVARVTGRAT